MDLYASQHTDRSRYENRCCTLYLQRGNIDDKKILRILNAANQVVIDLNSPARTTITAAFVEQNKFRYANAGDSRVYYFRNGMLFAQIGLFCLSGISGYVSLKCGGYTKQ